MANHFSSWVSDSNKLFLLSLSRWCHCILGDCFYREKREDEKKQASTLCANECLLNQHIFYFAAELFLLLRLWMRMLPKVSGPVVCICVCAEGENGALNLLIAFITHANYSSKGPPANFNSHFHWRAKRDPKKLPKKVVNSVNHCGQCTCRRCRWLHRRSHFQLEVWHKWTDTSTATALAKDVLWVWRLKFPFQAFWIRNHFSW